LLRWCCDDQTLGSHVRHAHYMFVFYIAHDRAGVSMINGIQDLVVAIGVTIYVVGQVWLFWYLGFLSTLVTSSW